MPYASAPSPPVAVIAPLVVIVLVLRALIPRTSGPPSPADAVIDPLNVIVLLLATPMPVTFEAFPPMADTAFIQVEVADSPHIIERFTDLTDKENPYFRYRL